MSNFRRWNFDNDADGRVLICTDNHEKGQPCQYRYLTVGDADAMQRRIVELENKSAKASEAARQAEPDDCGSLTRLAALMGGLEIPPSAINQPDSFFLATGRAIARQAKQAQRAEAEPVARNRHSVCDTDVQVDLDIFADIGEGALLYTTPPAPAPVVPDSTGTHHTLKTDPEVFQASVDGVKPWEIRLNDRGFAAGDSVTLLETRHSGKEMRDGAPLEYTGREVRGVIGYVLQGPVYGLPDEWCIFSLVKSSPQPAEETDQPIELRPGHRTVPGRC